MAYAYDVRAAACVCILIHVCIIKQPNRQEQMQHSRDTAAAADAAHGVPAV